jgi:hypothetical protein
MVAIAHPVIEEVFLRHGQLPLGMNPDAEPSLEDIRICKSAISDSLRSILIEDDVFSLKASYGDANGVQTSAFIIGCRAVGFAAGLPSPSLHFSDILAAIG